MMQREDNNTINRAVFTWLSKRIGFGFGFGFTTPFGWLEYLLWFWFYDSQVKTALIGTEVNMHQFKCLLNTVVDPGKEPKPSLNIFRPKWWPKKKNILLWDCFRWTQGDDEQHPHFLKVWIHHWTIYHLFVMQNVRCWKAFKCNVKRGG